MKNKSHDRVLHLSGKRSSTNSVLYGIEQFHLPPAWFIIRAISVCIGEHCLEHFGPGTWEEKRNENVAIRFTDLIGIEVRVKRSVPGVEPWIYIAQP